MKKLRCAIYTRKSSEEGLDMAFNSLDAQREACEAYLKSQRAEGWVLLPTFYDDGGFSGGSMIRPALARLLDDVKAGLVDVIVVYKVDRLTRSLPDFAKIVDVLDAAEASFVSVTQAFNTTTSMGRLTLNVLLSFAQFEREVIAERVRDKIAQSKARGIWMGGTVPYGYRVEDRRLQVVEEEAETVRYIYAAYLEAPSVRALKERLDAEGIVSRAQLRGGKPVGGGPWGRGALHWLLRNPIYIGRLRHRDLLHDGEH
jgi:site-specific DNA recombinase